LIKDTDIVYGVAFSTMLMKSYFNMHMHNFYHVFLKKRGWFWLAGVFHLQCRLWSSWGKMKSSQHPQPVILDTWCRKLAFTPQACHHFVHHT